MSNKCRGASDIYSISSHYRNWVFPHVSCCAYWVLDTGGGGSLNMAAASDVPWESRVEPHSVRTTDGQDRYNEAQRCQCMAPTDDTDAWKEDKVLDGKTRLRQCVCSSSHVFATSCLLSSRPNCCLAWRQLSLGLPFMPPLITSARKGTWLLLSLLSLVIKQLLTPSLHSVCLIRPEVWRYGLGSYNVAGTDVERCSLLCLARSHAGVERQTEEEEGGEGGRTKHFFYQQSTRPSTCTHHGGIVETPFTLKGNSRFLQIGLYF